MSLRFPVLACALLCGAPALARPTPGGEPQAVPGELIVRWRTPQLLRLDLSALKLRPDARRALRAQRFIDDRTEVLRVDPASVAQAIDELQRRGDVEYAEPNTLRRMALVPSDEYYPIQWYLSAIQAEPAWDISTGADATVVAVVDTGVRNQHPELVGRLLPGYDFISDPENAGDGDGRDPDPTDPDPPAGEPGLGTGFHGTHITGLIGALSNNARGIAGINWRCKILPLRVLGIASGVGADADISAAIRWAVGLEVPGVPRNANPAKVINLSFASPGYNKTLTSAIGEAMGAGAIVVASAGNGVSPEEGAPPIGTDARDYYPAAVSGVIAVGATDLNNQITSYSNYGQVVFVMAPGGSLGQLLPVPFKGEQRKAGIVSTTYDPASKAYNITMTQGTSQAAALVSGVVSLMVGVDPKLNQAGAARIIEATANKASSCAQGCGHGLIDARAAVATARANAGRPLGGGTVYGVSCALGASPELAPGAWLAALLLVSALRARRSARAGAGRRGDRRRRRRG